MPPFVTHAAEPREWFEKPEEYVGYALCDPLGKKIGSVEELFVNGGGEPEYVRVRTGLFGLRRCVLLPVEHVAVEEEQRALLLK